MWCKNPVDLFRLATIVQADAEPPRGKANGAYLFGHTPDNESSILEVGVNLYRTHRVRHLCLCGGGPYYAPNSPGVPCAYSGADVWKKYLYTYGVRAKDMHIIARPELSHTGTEAKRFIRYAKRKKWKFVYVVATPFHMLRAFTSIASFILREYPSLRAYALPGNPPTSWTERVVSSQGKTTGTRIEVMEKEWERLTKTYGNEYDLVSCEEVLEYIKCRDAKH